MEQIALIENGPVVHCNVYSSCTNQRTEEVHCWERARELCDFHYVFNVCPDCIVYLYGNDAAMFPRKDIEQILQNRKQPPNS